MDQIALTPMESISQLIYLVWYQVLALLFAALPPLGIWTLFAFVFGLNSDFRKYVARSIWIGAMVGSLILLITVAELHSESESGEPVCGMPFVAATFALLISGFAGGFIGAFVYPVYYLFTHATGDPPPKPGHINASAIAQWTKTH
jgi:hypothetical protein